MLKRWGSTLALVALVGLVAATACKKTEPGGGAPADTTAPARDTTMTSSTGAPAQVAVTNAMPHEMVVKADWGQGENELGTVEPNETKTFEVTAPSGTALALTATDKDASHSASGSVTLDSAAPAAWTIQ